MINILIVEDDIEIQQLLKSFLLESGYGVCQAYDGVEAIEKAQSCDLILLDILLPKVDGFSVLECIRKKTETPVILLTALGAESNQIKGFDLGADDYVTKPFSIPVLLRKIEAVLRRSHKIKNTAIQYKELEIDVEGMRVFVSKQEIKLTAREFEIVVTLFTHQGIVLTRDLLITKVWGDEAFCDDRIVNIHIKNIRKKLGVDYIETVRGVGYNVKKIY